MAFQTRDAVMMIVAFFLGLLIVSAFLAPPQREEQKGEGEGATSEVTEERKAYQRIVVTAVTPLSDGRFLALTQDGTLLLCAEENDSLRLLGEFALVRSEDGVSFINRKEKRESEGPKSEKSIIEHDGTLKEGGGE